MGIFTMSLAKQITKATAARDKLIARLADAERAVTDHRQVAEGLALDGADDEALSAAEAKTRDMIDRVATLRAALAKSKVILADLERERDEQADRKQREETSAEVEQLARAMSSACARLVADAAMLADHANRAVPVVPEASGVLRFCAVIANEIPQASDMIAKLLRVHASNVIAGSAPAAMPVPQEAYVEPPVPAKEPTQVVFALRSIKWRDAEGVQRLGGQFNDAELPTRLIGKALKTGAVIPVTDPRRRELRTQGGPPPRADTALDLDAEVDPVRTEPVLHSAFEKPVIGEARILKIAR